MRTYDVFISYAIEDKAEVAERIAHGLTAEGLKVYFAGDKLAPGKSVEEVVYEGLEKSEFYVLVLSPDYVRKWPIIERNYILHREKKEGRILAFPVWHRIQLSDVARNFPELLDRFADTTDIGIPRILYNLQKEVKSAYKVKRRGLLRKCSAMIALFTFAVIAIVPQFTSGDAVPLPSDEVQETLVSSRINVYEQILEDELLKKRAETDAVLIALDSVGKIYNQYQDISSQSRNDFSFSNGYEKVSGRNNIADIGITLALSPHAAYGLGSSRAWRLDREETDSTFKQVIAFCDTATVLFVIDTVFATDADSVVHMYVSYANNLRIVYYSIYYSTVNQKLRQHVRVLGFKPREEFLLEYSLGSWKIRTVK